ncbi:MAG: ATP-binding protein [Chloroflexota bacterium]|nr:ATP-binding protein [Chloroflexota bacterium]
MSKIPSATPTEIDQTVAQVHKFGAASESVFRRLYRGLHGRSDVQEHLRQQQELLLEQARRNEELDRRQRHLQRALRSRAGELERLHAVLGSVNDGIILQDLNGKVTMMNQAAQIMLGGRKAFWDSALGSLFEQYRAVTQIHSELMPLGDSDEIALNHRIMRAQVVAIGDENKRRIGTVIILRDVTHDALAQRLKDGYVSQIAQELETPMSVIKLAGELLNAKPEDAAVNRQLLNKLLFNVDLLDQLVLELLDIAEMNAGIFDVKRESVSVEDFLWSVVRGISVDLQARGIDLLVMTRGIGGLQVRGDDKRLQWALGHLVRNGAQYNRRGGYVALAARTSAIADRAYVSIRVTDNGIGIGEKDLPHIFERFYRGDNNSVATGESRPGLGQGLYVATAICEVHGGFLQVRSRLNVGSAFTMGLPLYG